MKELEVRALLGEEIERKLEALGKLEPGSIEHQRLSTDVVKLIERFNESVKNEYDHLDKERQRELDSEKLKFDTNNKNDQYKLDQEKLKVEQAEKRKDREHEEKLEKERNKFHFGSLVVPVTTTLISSGIFVWAYNRAQDKNLKFEETGRFCSDTGHSFRLPNLDRLLKR